MARINHDRYALICNDALKVLGRLPDNSVDTCLTSPPYWGVRDYKETRQIGDEVELDAYVEQIVKTFELIKPKLRSKGTVWLNLGDKYLSGISTEGGRPPSTGWKRNKQLALVPFRVAIALQEQGWWLRNSVVWHKPNGMPTSADDRLANNWEPVFLFSKGERYYFDLDAIRVPHKTDDNKERVRALNGGNRGFTAGASELRRWLSSPRHRATIDGYKEIDVRPNAPDAVTLASYLRGYLTKRKTTIGKIASELDQPFERVRHYFRTDEIGARLPPPDTWLRLKELLQLDSQFDESMEVQRKDNVFRNHPKGKNPGDVQAFGVGPNTTGHLATMPVRLAEWCLSATLPLGGVCLDPFSGSGTTGIAALKLGGKYVGIDISEKHINSSEKRFINFLSEQLQQAAE
jgi:DNA modification methylase